MGVFGPFYPVKKGLVWPSVTPGYFGSIFHFLVFR